MARPRLHTLILELTRACNHRCLYCYNPWRQAGVRAEETAPGNASDLLAHLLAQVDCEHVTLTGGEPLLYEGLAATVGFLAERGIRVNVITNGHLLTDARVAELVEKGVSLFDLPLLSFRRETHDALSGAPGGFDAVLAALSSIRAHQGQAAVAFVATRRNIEDLRDTLRLAFAFGVRRVQFNRFNPGGRGAAHIEDLLPSVEQVRGALETAERATQELGLSVSVSIPIQPCLIAPSAYPHLRFGFCAAGSSRAYYTLDMAGNVRPCNHSPSVLGNAWQEPFADIVAPERLRGFAEVAPAFCEPCALKAQCQGGCKAAAQVCYGDLRAEEPFLRLNRALARPLSAASSPA